MRRLVILSLATVIAATLNAAPAAAKKAKPAPAPKEVVVEKTVTVTTSRENTETETVPGLILPGSRAIHFEDYDLNHDGQLSRVEAGEMLFRLYDTDGNQVIDDWEFQRKAVLSVAPVITRTKRTVDDNGDGVPEKEEVTEEKGGVDTMLSQYDKNGDGLSAEEFTGKPFRKVDVNRSQVIEKKEWEGVYNSAIDAKNRAEAALNK